MTSIRWEGIDKLLAEFDARGAKATAVTPATLNDVLRTVAQQQRRLLNLGSHPRGTKTGSPPGSPPWRISGALMDSVTVRRAAPTGPGKWEGQVGATAAYARIQELGGDTGRGHRTHLPPRPSLYPAVAIIRPTIGAAFRAAWS